MTKHHTSPVTKSFDQVLQSAAAGELRYLIEHGQRLERMTRLLRDQLPPTLGAHCRVSGIAQQILILHTDSPAWVTKLRYYRPQLLAYLCRQPDFGPLDDILIKTVPPKALQSSGQSISRRLPASAVELLRSVAAVISPPALQQALLRLARPKVDKNP
jgi:hypothetical protein